MITPKQAEKVTIYGLMAVGILWLNNRLTTAEVEIKDLRTQLIECYETKVTRAFEAYTQEEQASSEFLVNSGNKPIDSGRKWGNTREATIETRNRNSRRGIIGGRG